MNKWLVHNEYEKYLNDRNKCKQNSPSDLKQGSIRNYFTQPTLTKQGYDTNITEKTPKNTNSVQRTSSPPKMVVTTPKRRQKRRGKDDTVSIKNFFSPVNKKDGVKSNSTVKEDIKDLSLEELQKKWAESDKQLENLKEIQKIAKEWEQNQKLREEERRHEEEERLAEIERRNNIVFKDCKHLTPEELQKIFDENVGFLDDIFYGRTNCTRHILYYRGHPGLLYNDSCAAFTETQIRQFIHMFHEQYDENDRLVFEKYYWSVLLPEFTLKIFMDMYKMDREEALHYLRFTPEPLDGSQDNFEL